MTKSSNSINNSMNSSNALVAPTRSEIRTSIHAVATSVVSFYHRNLLSISLLLVLALSACYTLGVSMPWYAAAALAIAACCSVTRACLHILSEAERFEQEQKKGGN